MVLNYAIIKTFEFELEKLGYPNDDIGYSLNYCHDDGVAFYGDVDVDKIVKRMYDNDVLTDDKYYLYKLSTNVYGHIIRVTISANESGRHYSNHNTMSVNVDGDISEWTAESILSHDGPYDEPIFTNDIYIYVVDLIDDLYDDIKKFIQNEIKEVSKKLEKIGYEIIESYEGDVI